MGLMGGINTYAYVAGNPISAYDPDGLQRIKVTRSGSNSSDNSFNIVRGGKIYNPNSRNNGRGISAGILGGDSLANAAEGAVGVYAAAVPAGAAFKACRGVAVVVASRKPKIDCKKFRRAGIAFAMRICAEEIDGKPPFMRPDTRPGIEGPLVPGK